MNKLTINNVLAKLQRHINGLKPMQIDHSGHPDYGGIINPAFGIADPRLTGKFIAGCAYLAVGTGNTDESFLNRALFAATFLLKSQRSSGLIDLLSVNYDSSPDTGFAVQELCPVIKWGRKQGQEEPQWDVLLEKLEQFVRRAVSGLLTGGFHTPNHRWVIVSALVQAKALFPDIDVTEVVEAYLAEGFDVDAEGAFLERSVGVYDAVNTRSLLLIAEYWNAPAALEAVQRNLTFDLHLLHHNGTTETGLSHRQDYGTHIVPVGLAACYLLCHHISPSPVFVKAAHTLWEQISDVNEEHLLWLCHVLLKCGDPEPVAASLPDDFSLHYPLNGLWRVRRNLLSASFFKGVTRLMTLTYGSAELSSAKISQTYFGQYIGRFVSDDLQVEGNTGILRSAGVTNPRRPGYELPLGCPVPPEKWDQMLEERSLRRLPPALSTLTVREVEGGFDLRYQTLDGLDGVAAQVAFDFPPRGIWETEDSRMMPVAGQVIFLKQGSGEMRYGNDVIRIEPGAYAHGMWQMRDAEPAPRHVRILITFLTPVDHIIKLRVYQGLKGSK